MDNLRKDEPTTSDIAPDGIIKSNWDEVVVNFDDMNLKEELLRGIYANGFERPTAIQQRAIIPCIKKQDVIAQAEYGAGKTATFCIAVLQGIDINIHECQALILAPTQELATQIQQQIISLGDNLSIKCQAYIDGTEATSVFHVLVSTPATITDVVNSRLLQTSTIKMFILDEFNEMLYCGFKRQIQEVFSALPKEAQLILFTDTMSTEVLDVSKNFMKNYVQIVVKKEELTLEDNLDIDLIEVWSKFGQKRSKMTMAINKYQVNEILLELGYVVNQGYINRLYDAIEIKDEINQDDFQKFLIAYNDILKMVQKKKQLSISTTSSTLSSDTDEYKKAKKLKIDGKRLAVEAVLAQIRGELDDYHDIPSLLSSIEDAETD